jgi:hypothetical protein
VIGARSPYSLCRAIGRLWPRPIRVVGKGERFPASAWQLLYEKLARAASPYAMVYAQAKLRDARERAGLGSHVTLDVPKAM